MIILSSSTLRSFILAALSLSLWSANVSPALAQADSPDAPNLVKDPGFESTATPSVWEQNNWSKMDAEFALDTNNPHSGTQSERLTIRKANAFDLQFGQHIPIHSGQSLRISFWIRGYSNSQPIQVQLRKAGSPWTSYFSAAITVGEQWTEHVLVVTLPDNVDQKDSVILFGMKDETSIWLDDVSVTELPPVEEGEPLSGNQLRNGSFEVGTDEWTGTFREGGDLRSGPESDENNINATLRSIPVSDAPQGKRVLSFQINKSCGIELTSGYFRLRYGHPATVGFWLKSDVPGTKLIARLGGGLFPNVIWNEQLIRTPDTKWNFYSFTAVPKPSTSGSYFFSIHSSNSGTYEMDDVTVVEGSEPLKNSPPPSLVVGTERAQGEDPANIFYQNEPAKFTVFALSDQQRILKAKVIDPWGVILQQIDLPVNPATSDPQQIALQLPTNLFGGFKCSIYSADSAIPLTEILYTVVPKLPSPGSVKDSFFGGHVSLTPYNLHIAERAGFRWLRLHPPLVTKWVLEEEKEGDWKFDTRGVQRAHDLGFKILGDFDTTPPFRADADPGKAAGSSWAHSWPPADFAAWRDYVLRTANAFGPFIDHWEVWNEPDGGFLQIPHGKQKDDIYVSLLKNTADALVSKPEETIIGGAVSSLHRPLTKQALEKGGGAYVDAWSFHYYDGCAAGTGPDETDVLDNIRFIQTFKNRSGKTMPVWQTESGTTPASWMDSLCIQPYDPMTTADSTSVLVRTAICFKAAGVQKNFYYIAQAHPAGHIVYRPGFEMIDANGIPLPPLAAHAAMVYLLEGAAPAGFDVVPVGTAKVSIAKFTRDEKSIEVLWSRAGVPLGTIPGISLQGKKALDIMGNPISVGADTVIGLKPIYLIDAEAKL